MKREKGGPKGIGGSLLEHGFKLVGRAADTVMSDPRGQEALARAVGLAQRGLAVVGSVQERALHAAGLAAKPDYEELRKQVARLKRKARDLSKQIDAKAEPNRAPSTPEPAAASDVLDSSSGHPRNPGAEEPS